MGKCTLSFEVHGLRVEEFSGEIEEELRKKIQTWCLVRCVHAADIENLKGNWQNGSSMSDRDFNEIRGWIQLAEIEEKQQILRNFERLSDLTANIRRDCFY